MAKINPRQTKALDDHPALKGGQSRLPDALQAKIIRSKLRKTAELNKTAFAYKRDALGALGGSLLGGGLGYASSTDGKDNTPDNRLKRTLIGAGIGGGVGLGFGRMSRKLKGAQDDLADARSRLDTAKGRIHSQDEAYDTLSRQNERIQDEFDLLHRQNKRIQDEFDLLQGQNRGLQKDYTDLRNQSHATQQAHDSALADAEAKLKDLERSSKSREQRLTSEVERSLLRAQLRETMDPNNQIPESVLSNMPADQLQSAITKRTLRRAQARNAEIQSLRQQRDRKSALDSLKRAKETEREKILDQFRKDVRGRIGPRLKLDAEKTSAWAPQFLGGRAFTKVANELEGRMAKRQLTEICEMAQELLMYMSDEEDLHEWVQNKITTIHDRLSSVHSYVSYEKKNPPMMMQPQILGGANGV